MVKLHYVNRKSEGLKLGQVVSKDLLKRIPPGSSYKTALRDPCIDLDVSGKTLTDEGLAEVAGALEKSIRHQDGHERVFKLEELCLAGNELTARSLKPLAKVIALAAETLRDLDLSNNRIAIITDEDSAAWRDFLQAFSRCGVLRCIAFSGNNLGPKAFEIFARVYGQEESDVGPSSPILQQPPVTFRHQSPIAGPSTPQKQVRKGSFAHIPNSQIMRRLEAPHREHEGAGKENDLLDERLQIEYLPPYRNTKGLRSVPYIVFSDTFMGDTCALYLSYIIACHELPHELLEHVPPIKAGPQAQQLETYDQIPGCQGIIYRPNPSIGSAGWKVLELAELERQGTLADIADEQDLDERSPSTELASSVGRVSIDFQTPELLQSNTQRRRSTVSVVINGHAATPISPARDTEIHRARSRIQGDSLRDLGFRSNDLWCTSLKMLSVARTILLEPTKPHTLYTSYAKTTSNKTEQQNRPPVVLTVQSSGAVAKTPNTPTVLGPGDPNLLLFPRLPTRKKEAVELPSSTTDLTMTPVHIQTPSSINKSCPPTRRGLDSSPRLKVDPNWRIETTPYRTTLPFGLPEAVWAQIILLTCEGDTIVSQEQSLAIVRWARDRETLIKEMETLGKAESTQIWRILEGMGCLGYEMKM